MLKNRSYMMSLAQGHTAYKHDYAKYVVRRIAKMKYTQLYLYFENTYQFEFDPDLGGKRAITPQEAKDLIAYASTFGIEVIPMLNLLGHCAETLGLEKYHHLGEVPVGENPETYSMHQVCPLKKETLAFAEKQMLSLMKIFTSKIIHVGCDEAAQLGSCPQCSQISKPKLFSNYVNQLALIARKNGKKIGIWGDMLLHHRPLENSEETEHSLDLLDKDIVIYDWQYFNESPETLNYFSSRGFEVVACAAMLVSMSSAVQVTRVENCQRALFKDCQDAKVESGMITHWQDCSGAIGENFWYAAFTGARAMLDGQASSSKNTLAEFIDSFYGYSCVELEQYFRHLGDKEGLIYSICPTLPDLSNVFNLDKFRKCLFMTDNPLLFWADFSMELDDQKLEQWHKAIKEIRRLWNIAQEKHDKTRNDFFKFLEMPLLVNEHLFKRYTKTKQTKLFYQQGKLSKAAAMIESHTQDFDKVSMLYAQAVHEFGNESTSLLRLKKTIENLTHFSAFLKYLDKAGRPLPDFAKFNSVFFEKEHTKYWLAREDEWSDAPKEFGRYSVYI